MLAALAGRDEGFSPLATDEAATRGVWQVFKGDPLARRTFTEWLAELKRSENAHKPVLVVLPGIMGSELALPKADGSGELIWLSLGAMLDGSLEHLALDAADPLRASGLLAASYERLLDRAQSRFRVVAVPFDWRRPIADSGMQLRDRLLEIDAALADATQPIHLLVHSMGGLVARQALYVDAAGRALWARLKPRGSRLVMLGTPNKGSYAPAMLLLRQYPLASMLSMMARKVSDKDMARFGAGFPGLLQMLPQEPDANFGDLFGAQAWQRIADADSSVQRPDAAVLAEARAFVGGAFGGSFEALRSDAAAFYVAGSGPTAVQMRTPQNPWEDALGEASSTPARAIEFMATHEGDGTVPWNSTLAAERTWYAPCEHGSLPDHTASFEAYFELLTAGHTQRLPQQPPRARSASGAPTELTVMPPIAQPALLPANDEELAAYVLAHSVATPPAALAPEPIAVRVIHGGLDYARYPLMVGHYQNAELSGAAKRVDEKLDGQLSQLLSLGLFVGATRTGHYLRPNNRSTQPPAYPGALMLGVGTVGELTPGVLADTVTRGVLRYAFEHVHRDPYAAAAGETVDLRLSTVLIGTHVQAVTPRDSLAGVLFGVWRAAQMLLQMRGGVGQPVRIGEVEILEIEEHVALDAAYELRRLLQRDEWAERLRWNVPVLEVREGGLSGYRPRTVDSVWQRLIVRQNPTGGLNFALIGERARVESTQVYSDVASLRRFIDRVSDNRAAGNDRIAGPTDPRFGGVLFQMLLPFELKERLANLDNTVLVLDDESARYPWELLSPPLAGPADGDRPRPFVVHAGMVRQRATEEFQRLLPALLGRHALIVGAPSTANWRGQDGEPLNFSALPGALAEARAVKELLDADGRIGEPVALIGDSVSFEQVRIALLERPYRLLHLCGHGVVDQWVRQLDIGQAARELRKTGMVLSDQEILSAADVRQMSPVPEFVFINGCYSGRDSELPPAKGQYPVLAASLALEFIRMGSRAVVAAGWQVDDSAALQFAASLYAALLQGDCFGEAVLCARQAVYADSGLRHNTWGAYQCYGDPQWRLVPASVQVEHPAGTSRLRAARHCMSADELAARILQVVGIAGDKPAAAVKAQLDELVAALAADEHRAGWLEHSKVRAALGEAYRELGEHDRAARWLQLGARSAYSNVQIGQLELLVNSLSRCADPRSPQAAGRLLDRLDAISNDRVARWPLDDAETERGTAASERQCQRGHLALRRAAQRLAEPEDDGRLDDVAADMAAAAQLFAAAWHSKKRFDPDPDRRAHALSNALMAAALAAFASGEPERALAALSKSHPGTASSGNESGATPGTRQTDALSGARNTRSAAAAPSNATATATGMGTAMTIDAWLAASRTLQDELIARDEIATFWHQTNRLELQVASTVLAHTQALDHPLDELGHALELLDRALVRWPSPSQLDSLSHRLHLVRAMALAVAQADSPLRRSVPPAAGARRAGAGAAAPAQRRVTLRCPAPHRPCGKP
ncbi:MAG: CHAT domain-containing protein [Methylibium sp.]|nr:CHAT domain-containing protein [Methylibium sp.]